MTPEELTELVEREDEVALVQGLSRLDERQRQSLSATAKKLLRKCDTANRSTFYAWLALMGVGPLSEAMKYRPYGGDGIYSALGQILVDRRPEWLGEWIDAKTKPFGWGVSLETVLPLIRAGCVSPITSNGVARSMVAGLYFRHAKNTIAESLLAEPLLLDAVYRLFETETDAFACYSGKSNADGTSWPATILELCAKGHLDRSRILSKSVQGLLNEFKSQTVSGITRLHDELSPTIDEQKRLENDYLALLGSPSTAVVAFTLRHLNILAKARRLDGKAFLLAFPRACQCAAKGHVKTAIGVVKLLVKEQPNLRSSAALAVAGSLAHPQEEVQEAAFQLIDAWAEPGDFQLSESLSHYREGVAASLQAKIDALLTRLDAGQSNQPAAATEAVAQPSTADDPVDAIQSRRAEIEQIPGDIRQRLRLDDALDACLQDRLPTAVHWTPLEAPILSGAERIAPIATLDELFDAVAHALERVDHGDDVERILDGISRLCDQHPDDFERRAAPLVARIQKLANHWGNPGVGLLAPVCLEGMAPVLLAWLTGDSHVTEYAEDLRHLGQTWRRSAVSRLHALAERIKTRTAAPLLAAPTHRGGWIDPEVWVERWKCLVDLGVEIPEIELCQSLLRLAPDGRQTTLERVRQIETPLRDLVVWALGGQVDPAAAEIAPAIWVAASRCRNPKIQLTAGKWSSSLLNGPDVLTPTSYRWRAFLGVSRYSAFAGGFLASDGGNDPVIQFDLDPPVGQSDEQRLMDEAKKIIQDAPSQSLAANLPGALQNMLEQVLLLSACDAIKQRDSDQYANRESLLSMKSHQITPGMCQPAWSFQWVAMLWPAKMEGYWKGAAEAFVSRMEKKASSLDPHSAFLEPLFAPDQPLTEMAALALWCATQSKDADARTAALDAWEALVRDGRGDARLLGQVLCRLNESGWLHLNRVADSMREVSRMSPLHAWTVSEILQDLLGSQETLARDAHHILQLLRELLMQLGLEARSELRTRLEALKGSDKAAKLARQLAVLAKTQSPERREAAMLAIDARLTRARRWCGN